MLKTVFKKVHFFETRLFFYVKIIKKIILTVCKINKT